MNRIVKIAASLAGTAMVIAGVIYGPDLWAYHRFGTAYDKQADAHQRNGGPWPQMQDSCALCHGTNGQSRSARYAALAGQPASYIESQLRAFGSGARPNPTMAPLALELSDKKISELAAFYSRQHAARNEEPAANPTLDMLGKQKVTSANCAACHGDGLGGTATAPRLAGQGELYLVDQLRAFRNGTRTDPTGAMKAIAESVNEKEIGAVSHYLAGLAIPGQPGE